tara:strand:- start:3857 stop:4465 length:609 start_codon:yes stop_codon:yes gene_type:complete
MTDKLDRRNAAQRGRSSTSQMVLLLVWVISLVVATQLFARTEGLVWPIIASLVCAASLAAWFWRLHRANRASSNVTERAFGRFISRQTLAMLGYVLGLVVAIYWLDRVAQPALRIGLIALPSLALAGWAWAFCAMIRSSDEMMQKRRARAIALAAGAVLVLGTIWGLFAQLLGIAELPGFLLLPGFSLAYGVTLQIIGGQDA